jgi:Protein of unknown function (DUF3987)
LATLSAIVERRAWVHTGHGSIWPNIFVLLTAPPGGGKTIITRAITDLIRDMKVDNSKKPRIAANSLTKSAMVDTLEEAVRFEVVEGQPEEWHSMAIINAEFGVVFPVFDQAFLSHLSNFWDCEREFEERTRTNKSKFISNPHVMMLGGIQPKLLNDTFPESSWGQGFFARTTIVYVPEMPKVKFFRRSRPDFTVHSQLVAGLEKLVIRWGELYIAPAVIEAFEAWEADDFKPFPTHPRLAGYVERRKMHAIKLAILYALSSEHELIELPDFDRARSLLERTEENLADLFVAMGSHEFSSVMDETVHFVLSQYVGTKKAVGQQALVGFVSQRAQPIHVEPIINTLVASGRLRLATPENIMTDQKAYVPGAKQ